MSVALGRSVLVVDDEPGIRLALQAHFRRAGWRVETAGGVQDALRTLGRSAFDLVVSDMRMPDGEGTEVMRSVRTSSPGTAFIFLTAFGTVPQAVQLIQDGAVDYLTKPVSFEQLEKAAAKVMRGGGAQAQIANEDSGRGMVGSSPALMHALQRARSAAVTDADVLVEAESGTGKELLAHLIHDSSRRRGKPFVAVNCAAVPETLLESELFGHARGAFTGATAAKPGKFEIANGGTLLLDEIGEMPLNLQPKLLRVLQEREFERLGETRSIRADIRVIATTNVHLSSMVERGLFRSDLYYRLNVIPLSLPPLRERPEDIAPLAKHFAEKFARRTQGRVVRLHPLFLERMQGHRWPGNVRELGNFMQRVLSLHPGAELTETCFDAEMGPVRASVMGLRAERQEVCLPVVTSARTVSIRELERSHLERTLELTRGNRTHAAEMLGISLRTVRNKIRQYDLPPRSYA